MTDSICLRCKHKRYCETGVTQPSGNSYVTGCSRFEPKPPQTNADKIRAMTDKELAAYIHSICDCDPPCPCFNDCYEAEDVDNEALLYVPCEKKLLDWLQKEADE